MDKIEIGHCKDCKWWEELDNPGYPTEPETWPICNKPENKYQIKFPVLPGFGCVHFEEKETQ